MIKHEEHIVNAVREFFENTFPGIYGKGALSRIKTVAEFFEPCVVFVKNGLEEIPSSIDFLGRHLHDYEESIGPHGIVLSERGRVLWLLTQACVKDMDRDTYEATWATLIDTISKSRDLICCIGGLYDAVKQDDANRLRAQTSLTALFNNYNFLEYVLGERERLNLADIADFTHDIGDPDVKLFMLQAVQPGVINMQVIPVEFFTAADLYCPTGLAALKDILTKKFGLAEDVIQAAILASEEKINIENAHKQQFLDIAADYFWCDTIDFDRECLSVTERGTFDMLVIEEAWDDVCALQRYMVYEVMAPCLVQKDDIPAADYNQLVEDWVAPQIRDILKTPQQILQALSVFYNDRPSLHHFGINPGYLVSGETKDKIFKQQLRHANRFRQLFAADFNCLAP